MKNFKIKILIIFIVLLCFNIAHASATIFSNYSSLKDTMLIYNEDNDSIVYGTDKKQKASLETNQNNLSKSEQINKTQKSIDYFLKKLKELERANNKKEIVIIIDSIAALYNIQYNYTEAINYFQKSAQIKKENGDKRGLAKTLNNLAYAQFNAGSTNESINTYLVAIKLREELKDKDEQVNLMKELAGVYRYVYNDDEAIKILEQTVKLKAEANDQKSIPSLVNSIGNLYFENNNIDRAISYFEQNLELEKKINDKPNIAASFNNLGIAYLKKDNFEKANELFTNALVIYKEINDKKGISATLNNQANLSFKKKDFIKSKEEYETAMKIKSELNDALGVSLLKYNLGNVFKEQRSYQTALKFFKESYDFAVKSNNIDLMAKNKFALSQVYNVLGDYRNAYDLFRQFVDMRQLLATEDKETQLSELSVKYSQEKEIHRLQKKLTKQDLLVRITAERNRQILLIRDLELNKKEELVKKQTIFIVFAVFVLLIILLFSFLLFKQFKKLKRSNNLLWIQKSEIENKRKLVETANAKLEEVNKKLEKLSIVASETDNGVAIMDQEGNFEWVNEGFTRLYGFTLESLIETRGKNIISASANPNVKIAVMSCLKQKSSVRYETNFPTVHGKKIWSQTTLTPIIDNTGTIIKMVAIDSDITKIKTIEEEIIKQRDEIEMQRDQIAKQRDFVMKQRDEISHQKEEITEGIIYAEHIQSAILPPEDYIKERLTEHFILYQPRDIVSGDFYWVRRIEHYIIFTAADCTGHGVPAALMSMMGSALLNEILNIYIKDESKEIKPSNILGELRTQIIKSLHQTGKLGTANDGMDMSLCILDTQTLKLQYAGANSPLYLVPIGLTAEGRNFPESVIPFDENLPGFEIKADKMPISIHHFADKPFTNHEIQLKKGDLIYLFSDGYIDQFGGPKYVKFRAKRFKQTIIEINNDPMDIQKKILEDTLKRWRGHMEQIDDILVFGVKI